MSIADDVAAYLAAEFGDVETGRLLAGILADDTLAWTAPVIAPDRIESIFAFTFGNRMLPNGNREPGPVNEALAEIALRLHGVAGAPIFAQWEIAAAIGDRIARDKLTAIYPGRDERAEPVYLSTGGVVEEIARLGAQGPVGVVAFADHLYRAVTTSLRFGFDAYAPEGYAMPATYDPQSGQPWCRSRVAYLLHDIMIRVTERRADLIRSA
jgi:hypothetical protein